MHEKTQCGTHNEHEKIGFLKQKSESLIWDESQRETIFSTHFAQDKQCVGAHRSHYVLVN